ncbi:hypothetical protein BG003_000638 [Podila horticola]|nr:hypothetical protein BG003_000638 [Podila horticola]
MHSGLSVLTGQNITQYMSNPSTAFHSPVEIQPLPVDTLGLMPYSGHMAVEDPNLVPSHAIFQPDGTAFDEGQICSNDSYGATALSSLALVLDGHLKLLDDDDMDMMHNMGEYEDLLSYISSPTPQ